MEENVGKKRIAIVDDELGGIRYIHLDHETQEFLRDEESDEFAEIWEKAVSVLQVRPLGPNKDPDVAHVVVSDDFVQKVILAPDLRANASPGLSQKLRLIWDRKDALDTLNEAFGAAFPAAAFDLVRYSSRPRAAELLEYDLLLLDLVMGTATPIEDLITYLRQLSESAAGRSLPSILLISNNDADLQRHRLRFRTEARISAAGLSILAKSQITSTEFAEAGLQLLWEKMYTQRPAADAIRGLMGSLEEALQNALEQTARTLWNLDAGALQRVHLTSLRDNDPFEEHLHELVSKEHSWHMEETSDVISKIAKLDGIFSQSVDGSHSEAQLTYSYATHALEDLTPLRELIRHFNWTPLHPLSPLSELKVADPATLVRYLPFGAVLLSGTRKDEVLLHLTQLCDLGKRDIFTRDTSLIFLRAQRKQYILGEQTHPDNRATQEVLFGLKTDEGDFDLVVDLSQLLAVPALEFQKQIEHKSFRVVARLRTDIAKQELLSAVAHVTRSAAFRFVEGHAKTWQAKLILAMPGSGRNINVYGQRPGTILDLSEIEIDNFHINDRHSFLAAVWLKQSLAISPSGAGIDFGKVGDALRLGLRGKRGEIVHSLAFKVFDVADINGCSTEVQAEKAQVHIPTLLIPRQKI